MAQYTFQRLGGRICSSFAFDFFFCLESRLELFWLLLDLVRLGWDFSVTSGLFSLWALLLRWVRRGGLASETVSFVCEIPDRSVEASNESNRGSLPVVEGWTFM